MVKKVFIVLSIALILIIPSSIMKITTEDFPNINIKQILGEKPIGTITIKKIGLSENLYKIDSPQNSVEKHVEILKESITPEKDNSLMVLAAHSGEGKIAYFEELDKLQINDSIILNYNNIDYNYIVKDIWEEKKTGYINFNREDKKKIVLTTCSPKRKEYQLVINCIEKSLNK